MEALLFYGGGSLTPLRIVGHGFSFMSIDRYRDPKPIVMV